MNAIKPLVAWEPCITKPRSQAWPLAVAPVLEYLQARQGVAGPFPAGANDRQVQHGRTCEVPILLELLMGCRELKTPLKGGNSLIICPA